MGFKDKETEDGLPILKKGNAGPQTEDGLPVLKKKADTVIPSAPSITPSNQGSVETTTTPAPQEIIPGQQNQPPASAYIDPNLQSSQPANGILDSAASTSESSVPPVQKVSQSILNKVVRNSLSQPKYQKSPELTDSFFSGLKKYGYTDEQLDKAKVANADIIPQVEPENDPNYKAQTQTQMDAEEEWKGTSLGKLQGKISDYVDNNVKAVDAGVKQMKDAVVSSQMMHVPGQEANYKKDAEGGDQGIVSDLKNEGTAVLNIGAGAIKTAFGIGSLVSPQLIAFNAATETIHSLPEDVKASVMFSNPTDVTETKKELAEKFDKTIDFPFTAASTIASMMGRKPEDGSAEKAVYDILNILIPIGAHKAGAGYSDMIKSAEDLQAISKKVQEGTATPEELKAIVAVSDGIKDTPINEVLLKHKLDVYSKISNEEIVKAQATGDTPEILRAKGENEMADAIDVHEEVANNPKEFIDLVNSDESMPPEKKEALVNQITTSAEMDVAQKNVEQAKVQHVDDLESVSNPGSVAFYHLAEEALSDENVLPRVKGSLEAAVDAGELSPEEAQSRFDELKSRIPIQEKINPAIKEHPELAVKAVDLAKELKDKEDDLSKVKGYVPPEPEITIQNKERGIENTKSKMSGLMDEAKDKTKKIKESEIGYKSRAELNKVSDDYVANNKEALNLPDSKPMNEIKVDDVLHKKIADAYDNLKTDNSSDPVVKSAYEALAKEVESQYDHIVKESGLKIEFTDKDPYPKGSNQMFEDVYKNKHLSVFNGGSDHPLTGSKTADANGITINDKLRAVHEYVHAKAAAEFGKNGEEKAWVEHSKMFSPEAQRALSTETRGQNAWVNNSGVNDAVFEKQKQAKKLIAEGKVAEGEKLAKEASSEFKFAEQKADLLPEDLTDWRKYESGESSAEASKEKIISEEESKDLVGVTNEYTTAMLKRLEIDPIMKSSRKSNPELWDSVFKEIKDNNVDPREEVIKLVESNDPLINKRVQALVLIDRVNVLNEHDIIQDKLAQAIKENDIDSQNALRIKEEQNKIDIKRNAIADEKIGGQWGDFGQFRQRLSSREYELASVERRAENANNGDPLDAKDSSRLKDLVKQHEELQKKYADILKKHEEEIADFGKREAEMRAKHEEEIMHAYKKAAVMENNTIAKRGREIAATIRKLKTKTDVLIDHVTGQPILDNNGKPIPINQANFYNDAIEIVATAVEKTADIAAAIQEGIKSMRERDEFKSLNEDTQKKVEEAFSAQFKKIEKETVSVKSLAEKVAEKADGELAPELKPLIDKMVYEIVSNDLNIKIDGVVDQVKEALDEYMPDIDKQDLKDLISGYGKFKELTKDEVKKQVAEIKLQGRLDSSLEATERGELPLRNGLERAKASQEARLKRFQIAKNIKEKNLVSPLTEEQSAARYKTELESYHRRLENSIADVEKEISENKRREKTQGQRHTDERSTELRTKLDMLKELRDEKLGKEKVMTEEQRVKAAVTRLEEGIEKINDDIHNLKNGLPLKPTIEKIKINDAKVNELRNVKAALEQERESLLPQAIKDQAILDKYRKGRQRRLDFLEEKLRKGDFSSKERSKPPVNLDEKTKSILADIRRVEKEVNGKIEELRIKNMTRTERAILAAGRLHRFSIFLGSKSMLKLTFAAMSRPVLKVPVEIAQFVLSHTPYAKEVMQKSITHYTPIPFQGSFIKYYSTLLAKETAKEAYRELIDKSDFNIEHGKHDEPLSKSIGKKILDAPQKMHGALKTFPKISQFESSLQKGLETLATTIDPKTGEYYDITKPEVVQMAKEGAVKDAYADIFMMDNEVSTAVKTMFGAFSRSKKQGVQALGLFGQTQMPVLKVPLNFYGEVLDKTPILGMIKALNIIRRAGEKGAEKQGRYPGGIKNLTPDQARNAARAMENQIVGAIGIAVGVGLYKIYGSDTEDKLKNSKIFTHNAFTPIVELGVRWSELADKGEEDKKTHEVKQFGLTHAGAEAIYESIKGNTRDLPFIKSATDITRIFKSDDERDKKAAQMVSSMITPSLLREIAQWTDTDKNGNEISRKSHGALDELKLPIPGLREQVGTSIEAEDEKSSRAQEEINKAFYGKGYDKQQKDKEEKAHKEKIKKAVEYEKKRQAELEGLGKPVYPVKYYTKDEIRALKDAGLETRGAEHVSSGGRPGKEGRENQQRPKR